MLDGKAVMILIVDYVFLYGGCVFNSNVLRLIGGCCLLGLALIAVFPKRKRQQEGGS